MRINYKNENRKYETNVVYQISMGMFDYIGQTSRPLEMRIKEHLYNKNSEVRQFIDTNNLEEIKVKILYHLPSNKRLYNMETKAMAQYIVYNSKKIAYKTLINRDFKGLDNMSIQELKQIISK